MQVAAHAAPFPLPRSARPTTPTIALRRLASGLLHHTRRRQAAGGLQRMTTGTPTMPAAAASAGAAAEPATAPAPRDLPPPLLSVAPMMDWTDVHYRQLARLLSARSWLYTEMVVDATLLHNPDTDRFLAFPPLQHPIAAQLGGSNPATLAAAAAIVATYGYDEVNLNCGCPSDRVAGAGCFGAALMKDPARVAAATAAMRAASGLEVTVKCRLGVDGVDSYAALAAFVRTVSEGGGVTHFLIHARACLLAGLSPAQNRAVPPLRPGWVLALARDFPHLRFTLNGGLAGSHAIVAALDTPRERQQQNVVGGMVGRAAYHTPWHALADADAGLYGAPTNPATSRRAVLAAYAAYADGARAAAAAKEAAALAAADPPTARPRAPPSIRTLVAPLLGLFHGAPRARAWRNAVDTALRLDPASVAAVLEQTLPILRDEDLDAPPEAMRPLGAGEAEASRRDAAPCPPVEWGDVPADPQSMDRAGLPAFWVDRPAKEGKKAKRKQLAEGGLVGCGEVEAAVP